MTALSARTRLCGWKTLNNAISSKHATVHREVAANHKSTHSRVLLSQHIRLVGEIRLVLAAIDKNEASEAAVVAVTLVHGVCPSASSTETCGQLQLATRILRKPNEKNSRLGCDFKVKLRLSFDHTPSPRGVVHSKPDKVTLG